MVLYGIKVKIGISSTIKLFFDFIDKGEANAAGVNINKYACSFSKMIQYWRQTWNNRTNGTTDIQFPFGFVQVSYTQNQEEFHSTYTNS
jgi:hypothetical protein